MNWMVSAISARGTVTTDSWISCSILRSAPRAEPAWMVRCRRDAGTPGFQEIERFSTP